jgi:rubrerythrin
MMFFFIGGIQPKTVTIDDTPQLCPYCGLQRARMKRIDHYLSLFFIPVFRVKKGDPVLICDHCGVVSGVSEAGGFPGERIRQTNTCPRCGKILDTEFRYCPYCGSML